MGSVYEVIFVVASLGSYLLVVSTLLLFQPQVLYGVRLAPPATGPIVPVAEVAAPEIPVPETPEPAKTEPADELAGRREEAVKASALSDEKKQEYRVRLDACMHQQQLFLQKGYGVRRSRAPAVGFH